MGGEKRWPDSSTSPFQERFFVVQHLRPVIGCCETSCLVGIGRSQQASLESGRHIAHFFDVKFWNTAQTLPDSSTAWKRLMDNGTVHWLIITYISLTMPTALTWWRLCCKWPIIVMFVLVPTIKEQQIPVRINFVEVGNEIVRMDICFLAHFRMFLGLTMEPVMTRFDLMLMMMLFFWLAVACMIISSGKIASLKVLFVTMKIHNDVTDTTLDTHVTKRFVTRCLLWA